MYIDLYERNIDLNRRCNVVNNKWDEVSYGFIKPDLIYQN